MREVYNFSHIGLVKWTHSIWQQEERTTVGKSGLIYVYDLYRHMHGRSVEWVHSTLNDRYAEICDLGSHISS